MMAIDKSKFVGLLDSLGIPRTDASTYIALLEMEAVSIRKIAAKTGINRGTTYEALKRLIGVGLVSVNRRGSREHYTAESPEKILDIIRDKRRELVGAGLTAKRLMPELLARQVATAGRPMVRYFEDDDGVVTILKDVLQTCRSLPKPEYRAYSSRQVRQYMYRRFPEFTVKRIEEGIHVRVIAVGEGGEVAENSERRWLPDVADQTVSSYMLIYGDKVAIVSITPDDTPYGVVIEDAGAATMQRLLFDHLWQNIGGRP